MLAVSVRELKAGLSRYLREVRSGEVILVTDRGTVVAELRPTLHDDRSLKASQLERLAVRGTLTLGGARDPAAFRRPGVELSTPQIDALLSAERGES